MTGYDENDYGFERLAYMLRTRKKEIRAWTRFSKDIGTANPGADNFAIGRKLLKLLASIDTDNNANVSLKIGQLIALDRYFASINQRPILVKGMTLIDSIAEASNVNFLVGSGEAPKRSDLVVSHWDLRATTYLTRSRLGQKRYETWDVNGAEHWNSIVTRIRTGANIAIGSPVANYASEVLLSRMIGVQPGKKIPPKQLPFFIVGADRDKDKNSAFVRTKLDAAQVDADVSSKIVKDRRSLVFDGRVFVATRQHDYALLVAQRSAVNRHVQSVLLGLTGRGTYQLARILQGDQPQQTVPEWEEGESHPPILLMLYRLVLEPDEENRDFAAKKVVNYAAVQSPVLLRFTNDRWRFPDNFGQSR